MRVEIVIWAIVWSLSNIQRGNCLIHLAPRPIRLGHCCDLRTQGAHVTIVVGNSEVKGYQVGLYAKALHLCSLGLPYNPTVSIAPNTCVFFIDNHTFLKLPRNFLIYLITAFSTQRVYSFSVEVKIVPMVTRSGTRYNGRDCTFLSSFSNIQRSAFLTTILPIFIL